MLTVYGVGVLDSCVRIVVVVVNVEVGNHGVVRLLEVHRGRLHHTMDNSSL